MSIIRKAQLLTLALSAGIGLAVLFTLDKVPAFSLTDTILSSQSSSTITPGSIVADPHPENSRQRVFRKVFAPDNKAPDYLLCSIDDDPDGINAYGIYHPADLAITLENLQKLDIRSVFIATHLQWPETEQAERNALSSAIGKFKHATIATPVQRTIKGDQMPDYFLRASLPASEIKGDPSSLPLVNKLSLPPNLTIPGNTLAGFSFIESGETVENSIPLIARWDNRVIFYAPLLEYLQYLGLKTEDLSVEVGKCIRLGNHGNIIPIDEFGYLKTDYHTEAAPFTITSAYSGEVSMIGITQTAAILSADGKKSSVYSSLPSPYNAIAQIAHTPGVGEKKTLSRFPLWLEILLIIDLAVIAAWLLAYRSGRRHPVFIISLFALCGIIFTLNSFTSYWSPSSPYLATLLIGWLFTSLISRPVRKKLLAISSTADKHQKDREEQTEKPEKTELIAAKEETKAITLPEPKKKNIHTGKHPDHDFEEEFISEGTTMFTSDSEEEQETAPGKITSQVKIDTRTEYPYFPDDSENE